MNYLPNRSWACLCKKIAELFGRVEDLEAGEGGADGTMASQDADNVAITGGTIENVELITNGYTSKLNEVVIHAVRKASAGTITKGQVVYIVGSSGTHLLVELADASTEALSSKTIGIAATNITPTNGLIMIEGELTGLSNVPTATYTNGSALWLSETTGEFTQTKPTQPAHGVFVGWVVNANNGSAGRIFVKIINYQELDELHDVLISGPAENDFLVWDDAVKLWKNEAPATARASLGITTGSVDNAVLRADGTGGATLQSSGLVIGDTVNSFAVTGDAGTDVITATGSAFTNGQPVRFTALTGGTGLATTTNYFVREVSGATFKVETSIGGGAVNFTTNITAGTLVNAHAVQPLVQVSENTSDTNSALVLSPKGDGAFIVGPAPDGTITGGNARGSQAIDIQGWRAAGIQVASGSDSIAIGNRVIANATGAVGIGSNVLAQAIYATAIGNSSAATRYGVLAHANGTFVFNGGAQYIRGILRGITTTNAAVELFLNGSTERYTIPAGLVSSMLINITGAKSDGSAVAHYVRQYSIKNVAGTTSQVYAPVTVGTDNAAGTSIAVSANDTNDALKIEATGVLNETWRWIAVIECAEIAYAL